MKFKFFTFPFAIFLAGLLVCGFVFYQVFRGNEFKTRMSGFELLKKTESPKRTARPAGNAQRAVTGVSGGSVSGHTDSGALRSLDELAELERTGSWFQGMALAEAGMRENTGDFTGAVAAVYKELAWAYGMGMIQKEETQQGLLNILALYDEDAVISSANAVLAFDRGQWAQAYAALLPLFDGDIEPDGFGRWMILVCTLEKDREDRKAGAAYRAIRARYVQFPEYWYRGARAFTGLVGAEYAENCINLSEQGPFAGECRRILASYSGLKNEDGLSLKTKKEIESVINQSVNKGNPQILESLFPLISLNDNPYTVYAVSALRALAAIQIYRDYFNVQASSSKGRLAERLSYICRSQTGG
ncbi:MAG: hypothetical protein LBH16_08805 [Treponema sp.]|jgi:hypothetical protein|nr:hypothetical protein [Treponema sp.]